MVSRGNLVVVDSTSAKMPCERTRMSCASRMPRTRWIPLCRGYLLTNAMTFRGFPSLTLRVSWYSAAHKREQGTGLRAASLAALPSLSATRLKMPKLSSTIWVPAMIMHTYNGQNHFTKFRKNIQIFETIGELTTMVWKSHTKQPSQLPNCCRLHVWKNQSLLPVSVDCRI